MSRNALIKNSTIYALGDIVPRLIGFISLPILTRYLSPSDYGIVNYVTTLNTFLLAIGFLSVNTYFLVYFYRFENREDQKKLLGNLSSFILLFNLVLVIILLVFGEHFFSAIGSKIAFYPYIVIAILTNYFNLFSILPSALFRAIEKPLALTILNVSRGLIAFALTLVLVIYYDYTALGVLYANLVVNFVFAFIFMFVIRHHIIWNLNFKQIKEALLFSLPLVPGAISYYLATISDRILIDKYLNLSDLGIYSIAATIALILNIFSFGAYKAFEPYIFKNWGHDKFAHIFQSIRNSYVYVLLVGVLILSLFAKEFFILMTDAKFHRAYIYVPMIIVGVYSSSLSLLYGTIITAKGKTKLNSMIVVIGAIISVSLNILFLPIYGLITAAVVSSFAMTVMFFMYVWFSKIKISHYRPVFSTVLVAVSVYVFVYGLTINNIFISLALKSVVFILVIVGVSVILAIHPIKMIKGFIIK